METELILATDRFTKLDNQFARKVSKTIAKYHANKGYFLQILTNNP
jgi:ABC-type phosphate/phosphonate transport system ATPase subunit